MPTAPSFSRAPVAPVCRALADDTRQQIVELLCRGERCVCDLQAELDVPQPLLSFHLRVLRDAGLVADRRDGRWAYYSLRPEPFAALGALLDAVRARAEVVGAPVCCP